MGDAGWKHGRVAADREHDRELAGQLREMARLARSAFARKELLRLATSFDYRARYLGRDKD